MQLGHGEVPQPRTRQAEASVQASPSAELQEQGSATVCLNLVRVFLEYWPAEWGTLRPHSPNTESTEELCLVRCCVAEQGHPGCHEAQVPPLQGRENPCPFGCHLCHHLVPFFTCRLVCTLLLTESVCLTEQDCKKCVYVRGSKGFPPCHGWEMQADPRPVLSAPATHPAHRALWVPLHPQRLCPLGRLSSGFAPPVLRLIFA